MARQPFQLFVPDHDLTVYRPYVDGLRAIAILAVVAFHVGLPGVPGGFVGVDIFFVISGFLIIGQIVAGLRAGSFSFAGFWARRVLRILPPYFLVLLVSMAIASIVLVTPEEISNFGQQAFYSALMVVNQYFLASTGYFDVVAEYKPLLHLWTLAVEEQFYLAAPIVLFLLWKAGAYLGARRTGFFAAVVALLFAASFVGCIVFTTPRDNVAFYLTPLRAWEFIAGGAIWFLPPFATTRLRAHVQAFGGLALILGSVVFLNDDAPFPGPAAFLPVWGASALIQAGLTHPDHPAIRWLASRPMVAIGLVSYSWYLWHWPLLSFSAIAGFGAWQLPWNILMGFVSLGLAVLTYFGLERPIRAWRRRNLDGTRGWRVVGAGVAAAIVVSAGGYTWHGVVAPQVASVVPQGIVPARDPRNTASLDCVMKGTRLPDECRERAGRGGAYGLVIGDSHAAAIYHMANRLTADAGKRLIRFTLPGCLPYLREDLPAAEIEGNACRRQRHAGMQGLERRLGGRITFAIITGRWFTQRGCCGPDEAELKEIGDGVKRLIERFTKDGIKRMIVVGSVPEFPQPVPECVLRADRFGLDRARCTVPREKVEGFVGSLNRVLKETATQFDNVRYVDAIDVFCGATTCTPYDGDIGLYVDRNHVSDYGADRIYQAHAADFDWAIAAAAPVKKTAADRTKRGKKPGKDR